jgi:hypothetical protein
MICKPVFGTLYPDVVQLHQELPIRVEVTSSSSEQTCLRQRARAMDECTRQSGF